VKNEFSPTEFEKLLVKYQQRLSPSAVVEHNKTIIGKSSTTNQCDAVMKFVEGGIDFLVIFECKYHKKKIDISKLREFYTKINEVGATKGVFVSKEGFTKQSHEFAKFHSMELYTLINYNLDNSSKIFNFPIKINFIQPKSARVQTFNAISNTLVDLNTITSPDFAKSKGNPLIYNQKENIWYTLHSFSEEIISDYFEDFESTSEIEIKEDYFYTPFHNIKTEKRQFNIPLTPLYFKIEVQFLYQEYISWIEIDKLIGFDNKKEKNAFSMETKSFEIKDIIDNAYKYDSKVEKVNTSFSLTIKNRLLPNQEINKMKLILNEDGNIKLEGIS